MEHLVRFSTAEGRDAHHTAESLDDALKFVERLRNAEDVDDVRLYRLTPVPIEFKVHYKVEIRPEGEGAEAPAVAGSPAPGSPVPAPPADEAKTEAAPPVAAVPAAAPTGEATDANGRRLFARG